MYPSPPDEGAFRAAQAASVSGTRAKSATAKTTAATNNAGRGVWLDIVFCVLACKAWDTRKQQKVAKNKAARAFKTVWGSKAANGCALRQLQATWTPREAGRAGQ